MNLKMKNGKMEKWKMKIKIKKEKSQ